MSKVISVLENNVLSMTLKEITDLLEVRHDNAMRVVNKMVENKDFGTAPQIEESYNGKQTTLTYKLNKRQSLAVAAKLNVSLLMIIIDRWQFLEDENLRLREDEKARLTQRNEARVGYYPMLDALVESRAIEGKGTELTHFMKEANLLNRIVLGKTSRQYRLENKIPTLRDYLPKNKISAINDLQLANMVLINLNFNYEDRKTLLDKRFKEKWINLVEEDILILLE